MKNKTMPKFKAKITNEIKVNIPNSTRNSNIYYTAKNMEHAEKLSKELVADEKRKWKEQHDLEILRFEKLERLERSIENYEELLKKELWHDHRNSNVSDEIVSLKKKIRKHLVGFMKDELECVWNQSALDDTITYTIEQIKK